LLLLLQRAKRHRAEKSLRDNESRLRSVLDTAGEGIITINERGIIESANPAAEKIFGYRAGELAGQSVSILMPPPVREEHDHHLGKYLLTLESKIIGVGREVIGQRKDGSVFPMELHVNEIKRADGRILTGFVRDMSERRRSEEQLLQLRQQLWHTDRVAQTGAITASLAHEINQPLAAILSNAQAGLRFMAGENFDREEIREILTDIVNDDKRAGAVISGLRTLLQRRETQREQIRLADTIQEVFTLLHGELLSRQVECSLRLESDCQVMADKPQIQQVILNLAMNAMEAMNDQPAGQRQLQVTLTHDSAGTAQVAVYNSGPGIPEDQQGKLFEAFWTTKEQGMGIGLPIARSIIESHGGRIWLASNPDRGVTFYLTLSCKVDHTAGAK
jgi:two-component system sensor kinase FixL